VWTIAAAKTSDTCELHHAVCKQEEKRMTAARRSNLISHLAISKLKPQMDNQGINERVFLDDKHEINLKRVLK